MRRSRGDFRYLESTALMKLADVTLMISPGIVLPAVVAGTSKVVRI